MGHTPYGYRIENGTAVIDDEAASKIRLLYANYLSGMALVPAAKAAGIETYHGTARRLMENHHYIGDDFYPAIIDRETFDKATEVRLQRAKELGRLDKERPVKTITVPTRFHFTPATERYDNPVMQAEYLYSLIESEEI